LNVNDYTNVCVEYLRTYAFCLACHSIHSGSPSCSLFLALSSFIFFSLLLAVTYAAALFPLCVNPAARINKIRLSFLTTNASRRTKRKSKKQKKKQRSTGVLAEPGGITSRRLNHLSRDDHVWSYVTSKERRLEINDYQR